MFTFTFLSFVEFEATAIFSEEEKSPEKTIPRATYIAVIFVEVITAFGRMVRLPVPNSSALHQIS